MTETITLRVIKASQTIGDLYIAVMEAKDLFDIAEVNRIELTQLEVPKYTGYQRALSMDRVSSIRDYLTTPRSTFPNAIICSLDSEYIIAWEEIELHPGISLITIERNAGAVTIIDGQHRAAALNAANEDFQVIVSFFIDLNIVRSAEIFAKINSTQRSVNPSIAFQLFGYSEERSPQKTAHQIAELMNTTEGSPFYRQLQMLGTMDSWAIGTLSQSTFSKQLMKLYTRNPEEDQNALLRGEDIKDYSNYPFRDWFRNEEDDQIMEVVWKYFFNIAQTWPDQWFDQTKTSILPKTTGYSSFMAVLKTWLLSDRSPQVLHDEGVRDLFAGIKEKYDQDDFRFLRDNYGSGNSGIQALRNSLTADLDLD